MNYETFKNLADKFNFIPVYEKITADLSTPVSAYLKLRNQGSQSFLLESVEGKESLGRYSFIGINPQKTFSNVGLNLTIKEQAKITVTSKNIFNFA